MNVIEMYAVDSDGEYLEVTDSSNIEHRYFTIQCSDGFKITGHSAFFKGAYEDALNAWTENNDSGIVYKAKDQGDHA